MSKCDAGTDLTGRKEGSDAHESDPNAYKFSIESGCNSIGRSANLEVGNVVEVDRIPERTDANGGSKMGEGHGLKAESHSCESIEEEGTLQGGIPSFEKLLEHIVGEFEMLPDGKVVNRESGCKVPGDILLERERELAARYCKGNFGELRIHSLRGWIRPEVKAIVEVCCPSKEGGLSLFWDKELKTIFSAGEQSHTPLVQRLLKLEEKFNTLRKLSVELESFCIFANLVRDEAILPDALMKFCKDIKSGLHRHNFLWAVFSVMRMAGGDAESDGRLRRLRRSFVDRLSEVPLNARFSFQRHFFLLFASAFQISRAIFATVFTRSILGDESCLEWSFPEKKSRSVNLYYESESVEDFPRWVESRGTGKYEIGFYNKRGTIANGGLKIVVWNLEKDEAEWVFFSKLYHGGVPLPPVFRDWTDERVMCWMAATSRMLLGDGNLNQTELDQASREMCFLDFGEILMYSVLEALFLGPRAIFVMDAYSVRSFHILTEKIVDGIFLANWFTRQSYMRTFSSRRVEFLQSAIIHLVLGLEDVDENNFCFVRVPDKERVQIIDFKVPKTDSEKMKIPDNFDSFAAWFFSSSLMNEIMSIPVCDLESAFLTVKGWLEKSMHKRHSRLFVYPPPKGSVPLIDLLKSEWPTGPPMGFSDFLEDCMRQILKFFFVERLDEKEVFQNRCLVSLEGKKNLKNFVNYFQEIGTRHH
jgi:hypothetical protein